jgi:predicted PurR-regulated permease PerM
MNDSSVIRLFYSFPILFIHPNHGSDYFYRMNNTSIDNNLLKQIFFIAVILFLGVVLFNQLQTFLPAFLGAVTFYVLMRNRMFQLAEKRKWKPAAAAWVLMLLSFFVILVPVGLLGNILYSKN